MTTSSSFFTELLKTQSELLTRKEAACYLGVSANTLAVWASTKRYPLTYIKIGRSVKYRKSDLDDFIKRNTINHLRQDKPDAITILY